MKTGYFTLLLIMSLQLMAQDLTSTDISVDSRYDEVGVHGSGQSRVKIGFVIDAKGIVEIVGLVGTGPAYKNEWVTFAPNEKATDFSLAFRNLYLRKTFGEDKNVVIEAGALNSDATVGSAGMAGSGWVDGLRVKAVTTIADFRVVAGSLGSFTTPNPFARDFTGNFLEIDMSKKVFDQLTLECAYQVEENGNNAIVGAVYDLKILGDKVIKVFGKALYSFDENVTNYDIGVELDVLKTILNKYDKRLELKIYVSKVDEKLASEADKIPLFYTFGPRTTFQLSGVIVKDKLSWVARSSFGENNTSRQDIGIQYKFGLKKKQ